MGKREARCAPGSEATKNLSLPSANVCGNCDHFAQSAQQIRARADDGACTDRKAIWSYPKADWDCTRWTPIGGRVAKPRHTRTSAEGGRKRKRKDESGT